jgi:hypothetical protein
MCWYSPELFDGFRASFPASNFAPERANPLSDQELNTSGNVYAQAVPPEKSIHIGACRRAKDAGDNRASHLPVLSAYP